MARTRILSWNVNGLRAVLKKGFLEWFSSEKPDILCLQETKAHVEQLPSEAVSVPGYHSYFSSAEKKGYSGVAIYSNKEPLSVSHGFGVPEFDMEGRILRADFDDFVLFNIYFPNGKASDVRLRYKLAFYEKFLEIARDLRKSGKRVVACGDYNTAHKEIDLARPKANEKVSGFLPIEREWIDRFIQEGFHDTFRLFNQQGENYSWWDYKTRARQRNTGWRIDYFFASDNCRENIRSAFIMTEVMGSDHCPVGIEIE